MVLKNELVTLDDFVKNVADVKLIADLLKKLCADIDVINDLQVKASLNAKIELKLVKLKNI